MPLPVLLKLIGYIFGGIGIVMLIWSMLKQGVSLFGSRATIRRILIARARRFLGVLLALRPSTAAPLRCELSGAIRFMRFFASQICEAKAPSRVLAAIRGPKLIPRQ